MYSNSCNYVNGVKVLSNSNFGVLSHGVVGYNYAGEDDTMKHFMRYGGGYHVGPNYHYTPYDGSAVLAL